MRKRSLLLASILIGVSTIAPAAAARTWGVSAGPSKLFDDHVNLGFRCAGTCFEDLRPHFAFGVEAAFDRWSPSGTPNVIGVDWHASGVTYVLEITPELRVTTAKSDRDPEQLFAEIGAGAGFVSSNAEVEVSVPGYPGSGQRGYDLDSQVAPLLSLGIGGRFLSGGAFGEVDLKLHVLFTNASTEPASSTNYLSLSFGVAF
ncbi:MAG: hypothetical protein ABR899_01710 [Candidatus Krumholzibacteriaceae bacterium]